MEDKSTKTVAAGDGADDAIRHDVSLREIAAVFLRLGFFAYGGPAAHIAMMNEELVEKRKWVSRQRFLDLMSATNLIPGPNSTELAITLGYEKGGWRGLNIAGMTFILPAFLIVLIFAWIYAHYGLIPQVQAVLAGVKPVVIAIILQALIKLFRTAVKNWYQVVLLAIGVTMALLNVEEIWVLGGIGLLSATIARIREGQRAQTRALWLLPMGLPLLQQASTAAGISVSEMFLRFLKIGAILYGSGYVLVAYLESEFVKPGFLSNQQLLDAVAVGQITPGPVFTTATFVGYQLGGLAGGVLATIGIFLPSFLLVGLLVHITDKMRRSKLVASILDGINVASLALMGVTSFTLAQSSLLNPVHWGVFGLSLLLLIWKRVNSIWLMLAGALIGALFLA
ncbi:MAG: chromate efflux transporter [Clostridiaceae bacterium]|nr:chromate efflux transporter [Clostridiaceae bacterium]